MASPIGHAAVGIAVASVVAKATGTAPSAPLWVGAFIASGIPDLDVVFSLLGFRGRYHRNWSHSFPFIGAQIVLIFIVARQFFPGLGTGVLLAWAAALLSHPLLDVITTGPTLGKGGWGIPLWWPLSRRRFFVTWPVLGDRNEGLSIADTIREMREEALRVVPVCAVVVLVVLLWK
jgi:membrane-bound metal-dependent hydrolase YbcI (DUF457 family)